LAGARASDTYLQREAKARERERDEEEGIVRAGAHEEVSYRAAECAEGHGLGLAPRSAGMTMQGSGGSPRGVLGVISGATLTHPNPIRSVIHTFIRPANMLPAKLVV